jgi:hypothetical protein
LLKWIRVLKNKAFSSTKYNKKQPVDEAVLGLATFYYEMSDELHRPDYYGYVKNGVSLKLEQGFTLKELQNAIENAYSPERNQAIKSYSETYSTEWQNREGELTAWVIQRILNDEPFDGYFDSVLTGVYRALFKLKQ